MFSRVSTIPLYYRFNSEFFCAGSKWRLRLCEKCGSICWMIETVPFFGLVWFGLAEAEIEDLISFLTCSCFSYSWSRFPFHIQLELLYAPSNTIWMVKNGVSFYLHNTLPAITPNKFFGTQVLLIASLLTSIHSITIIPLSCLNHLLFQKHFCHAEEEFEFAHPTGVGVMAGLIKKLSRVKLQKIIKILSCKPEFSTKIVYKHKYNQYILFKLCSI